MAKFKKGTTLVCIPCGREVEVSSEGISAASIWCCGRPMKVGGARKKRVRAKQKKKK
jgi:hypothetical protein